LAGWVASRGVKERRSEVIPIPMKGIEERTCWSREYLPVLRDGRVEDRGETVFEEELTFYYFKTPANEEYSQNHRFSICCTRHQCSRNGMKSRTLE